MTLAKLRHDNCSFMALLKGAVLSDVLPVLGLFVVVGGVYFVSLLLNPMVTCRKCHGKPRPRGWLFSYAQHFCPRCEGTGLQARLGRKILDWFRTSAVDDDPSIAGRWPWNRQAPPN